MLAMNECEWRPVVGFEAGRYEVNRLGQVRSWIGPGGKRRETPKILVGTRLRPRPYVQLQMRRNGASVMKLAHVLVLEAFVGPAPSGTESSHLDDNPENNDLSNLAWETPSRNCERRRVPVGEDARNSKLSAADVLEIRAAKGRGERAVDLAARFGVTRETIYGAIRGWADLCGYRGAAENVLDPNTVVS